MILGSITAELINAVTINAEHVFPPSKAQLSYYFYISCNIKFSNYISWGKQSFNQIIILHYAKNFPLIVKDISALFSLTL